LRWLRYIIAEVAADSNHSLSSQSAQKAAGLKRLSSDTIAMAMQVHPDSNPMEGLEGRAALLTRLGSALESDENGYFDGPAGSKGGKSKRRPGYLVGELSVFFFWRPLPREATFQGRFGSDALSPPLSNQIISLLIQQQPNRNHRLVWKKL